ncbi:MAG TPA: cytochrome c [Gemmatimonadaceae bacterium]
MAKARGVVRLVPLLVLVVACERRTFGGSTSQRPDRYELGRAATQAEVAAIDIDVNPTGASLPPGRGTPATGAVVYAAKCAACHGPHGEGIEKNPKLISKEPRAGFVFAGDVKAPKTIGNYWPYATTLFDYIRRTMPLNAPGSLTTDEIYGLVGYLLAENGIVAKDATMDAKSLPAVKMPAKEHFVRDNRTGGATFR